MDEAYGTDDGLIAYCVARNIALPGDPEDYAGARLVASEWIDNNYESSFPGSRFIGREQPRAWPRYNSVDVYGYVIPSDKVPVEVENATYEAAIRQLANPAQFSPDFTPAKYKRVSIDGAIAVDFVVYDNASDIVTQFPIIAQCLAPILMRAIGTGSRYSGFTALA